MSKPGQVLHILECCGGGAAVKVNQELLSASCMSDPSNISPSGYPRGNFVQAVANAMRDLKNQYGHFTVTELHAAMISNGPKMALPLYIQPWYTMGAGTWYPTTLAPLNAQGRATQGLRGDPKINEEHVLLNITVAADMTQVEEFSRLSSSRSWEPHHLPYDANLAVGCPSGEQCLRLHRFYRYTGWREHSQSVMLMPIG